MFSRFISGFIAATLCLFISVSISQELGNEWIHFQQQYYKINISQTGICRITQTQLAGFGVPVSSFNPQNVQVFFRGREIPVYIKGESQGLFEYIEFYAQKNDAWADSVIYQSPESVSNPYYSMVTDTSAYFFTWNNLFTNKRYLELNDINFSGLVPANFIWAESVSQYTARYFEGLSNCQYTTGEGWFDNATFGLGGSITKNISLLPVYSSGPEATMEISIAGYSAHQHHLRVLSNNSLLLDTVYNGYKTMRTTLTSEAGNFQQQNQFVLQSIDDLGSTTSNQALGFIRLRYPAQPNAGNSNSFSFEISASAQKTYVELSGFVAGSEAPVLYDTNNKRRIKTVVSGNLVKFVIPPVQTNTKLILVTAEGTFSSNSVQPASFTNFTNLQSKYLIVTHPSLFDAAQNYKAYRQATVASTEELYNQFGYGISKHPLAIRNFAKFAMENWQVKPEFLFLIGKGIGAQFTRNSLSNWQACLVPSMGNPPSDNLFTAGLGQTSYEPALATGRIAVINQTEVQQYLDKVMSFEQNQPDEWMKNIIHFSGGQNAGEQNLFASYLANFENIIEDTLFGAVVSTFRKNSSAPIQITANDSIKKLINNGVTLMTFFGHGAASVGFDQNIDQPSSYDNYGKYPIILANSCNSGNIHLQGHNTISEQWVLIPSRGSIIFLASVHDGLPSYLNFVSTSIYKNMAVNSYGKSFGEIFKNASSDILQQIPNNSGLINTIQEFALHGDPAIVPNQFQKPDFKISSSSFILNPQIITTELDSFDLKIIVTNIGKSLPQPYYVEISRSFPDGSTEIAGKTSTGIIFRDTLSFRFPVNRIKGPGSNIFRVFTDINNQIDELSELNNNAEIVVFISSADLVPVFPPNQAIVPNSNFSLIASTGDVLTLTQQSIFEIDTSIYFNSPFKKSKQILHSGGIVEWNQPFVPQPGTAYYWRVSKVPENKENYSWRTSSFTFLPDQNGWAQVHFNQLESNNFTFIQTDANNREFKFITTPKQLICNNIGSPSNTELYNVKYEIDGVGDYGVCGGANAILVAVIDSMTLIPWSSDYSNFGHSNYPKCKDRNRTDLYFIFSSGDQVSLQNLANFITDSVPNGHYLLAWSVKNGNFQSWPEECFVAFENLGASNIRAIPNNYPMIFFVRKGQNHTAIMKIGQSVTDQIELITNLKTNFTYGYIESPLVGPSANWSSINWETHPLEANPTEITKLQITGIDLSGHKTLLIDSISSDSDTIVLHPSLNPGNYPYLQLKIFTRDDLWRTPAQPDQWQVHFDSYSELALDPASHFSFISDTLNEGDSLFFAIALKNIGLQTCDSILAKYWITTQNNQIIPIKTIKKAPLLAGATTTDSLWVSTFGLKGINRFWVEYNSIDSITGNYDQPEIHHFNNSLNKIFYILPDRKNPFLDVTFDGIHIADGELVSANPQIIMQLSDENKFLELNDTSMFAIYLKYPGQNTEQRIYFDQMEWIPAQLPKNSCKVIFRPRFNQDGFYMLRVQAKDISDNLSGKNDFKITFKIILESTITEIFNYPNPFSTSTRFVFTLTGSETPDEMMIQIMTITGKIVRTLTLDDMGPIHVGKNISSFAWDGTDMFGDRLGNGVYFYKVVVRLNGQNIKKDTSGQGSYFKHGFGKMYLMR